MESYDVCIVGAGPGGIFAALRICERNPRIKVILFDRGPRLEARDPKVPKHCLYGFSGAGAFSDGKLTISDKVGGDLADLDVKNLNELIEEVDQLFISHGAPTDLSGNGEGMMDLQRRALACSLNLVTFPVRHIGTDLVPKVMASFQSALESHDNLTLKCDTIVKSVEQNGDSFILRSDIGDFACGKVIVGVGRGGNGWLRSGIPNGIEWKPSFVDLGIRLEAPRAIFDPVTNITHDPKLIYYSKRTDDRVRTFCVNPGGWVSLEENIDEDQKFYTINGHSNKHEKTEMTNMALLTSVNFTQPFNDPFAFGKHVASLTNLIGVGSIVQRLTDLKRGRRSTWERINRNLYKPTLKQAEPGDVSFVLPYRQFSVIIEMIDCLSELCPGLDSDNTYLYGTEVKFYGSKFKVDQNMESSIPGLYMIGDASGWTRGMMQAAVSGIISGQHVLNLL